MNERTILRSEAASAASARRFVADVLSSRGFDNGCVEDAVLLASEIVTTTIARASSDLDLVIVADHPMARVEVHDTDASPPVPPCGVEAADGPGAKVLDALAEAWGVDHCLDGGKCVWFELRS